MTLLWSCKYTGRIFQNIFMQGGWWACLLLPWKLLCKVSNLVTCLQLCCINWCVDTHTGWWQWQNQWVEVACWNIIMVNLPPALCQPCCYVCLSVGLHFVQFPHLVNKSNHVGMCRGEERSRRVECSVAVQEEWKTLAGCTLLFLWVKYF